jgi:hypothetical protein
MLNPKTVEHARDPTLAYRRYLLVRPGRVLVVTIGVSEGLARLWISCGFLVLNNKDRMSFILLKSDFF